MWRRLAIAAIVAVAATWPVCAQAAQAPATGTATPTTASAGATASAATTGQASKQTTGFVPGARVYDLDFTLPTAGKSGCLVCHGDPNLAKVGAETTSSIFVDVALLQESAHEKDTPCTGCHLNFAYTAPHVKAEGTEDWISAARLACKNCHTDAFSEYANGSHSLASQPGKTATETVAARVAAGKPERVPLCGDCHGGHAIPAADDVSGQRVLHLSGARMCGPCHEREADSYNDYYHGRAYKRGSLDAPSCWDCHGYHKILPSSDRLSPTHPNQLSLTCGQTGCHDGADETFIEYAELVHGDRAIREANPLLSVVQGAKDAVAGVFGAITSLF